MFPTLSTDDSSNVRYVPPDYFTNFSVGFTTLAEGTDVEYFFGRMSTAAIDFAHGIAPLHCPIFGVVKVGARE